MTIIISFYTTGFDTHLGLMKSHKNQIQVLDNIQATAENIAQLGIRINEWRNHHGVYEVISNTPEHPYKAFFRHSCFTHNYQTFDSISSMFQLADVMTKNQLDLSQCPEQARIREYITRAKHQPPHITVLTIAQGVTYLLKPCIGVTLVCRSTRRPPIFWDKHPGQLNDRFERQLKARGISLRRCHGIRF